MILRDESFLLRASIYWRQNTYKQSCMCNVFLTFSARFDFRSRHHPLDALKDNKGYLRMRALSNELWRECSENVIVQIRDCVNKRRRTRSRTNRLTNMTTLKNNENVMETIERYWREYVQRKINGHSVSNGDWDYRYLNEMYNVHICSTYIHGHFCSWSCVIVLFIWRDSMRMGDVVYVAHAVDSMSGSLPIILPGGVAEIVDGV